MTDATPTFAMIHPRGPRCSPAEIKARVGLVQAGGFARVDGVDDALAGPALAAAA